MPPVLNPSTGFVLSWSKELPGLADLVFLRFTSEHQTSPANSKA